MAEERRRYIVEFPDIPAERREMQELPVAERVSNFKEVELGLTEEAAQAEARRCLSCRRCLGCALCWAECKPEAIVFEQEYEELELDVDRIIIAPPVLRAPAAVDRKLGYGKYANLVTDLEFERILSPSGLYGGLLLRPYDGDVPQKVAFIHNLSPEGSRGEAAFRSLANLMKLAALAQNKVSDLETTLFVSSLGDYEKPFEELRARVPRLSVKMAEVAGIEEVEDTRALALNLKDGGQGELFDMVVVATLLAMPEEIRRLSQQLELGIERQTFCEREGTAETASTKPGLFFSGWAPL